MEFGVAQKGGSKMGTMCKVMKVTTAEQLARLERLLLHWLTTTARPALCLRGQNVATNPIVLFTVLGLLYNLATGAKGTPLWAPIDQAFETAGNGFTVCALFMLGAGMYGNLGLLKGKNLVLPMLLSLTKVALVAIAIRLFMNFFTSNEAWPGLQDQKEFSYIYGDSPALSPSPPPPRRVAQHSCAW